MARHVPSRRLLLPLMAVVSILQPALAFAAAEQDLVAAIRARLDAYAQGSADEWARYVVDDCICGLETRDQIRKAIAARLPAVKNWYGAILDLQVRHLDDAAVARYRITEYSEVGGQKASVNLWRTETYTRRAGTWMLVAGADIVIPSDPAIVSIDASLLDAYVGQYEFTPGSIDTVTRQGDHLRVQSTGEPAAEIFAENDTTFFAKGQGWRLVFEKDANGSVAAVVFRENGQEFRGARLKR